jgi:hypothetical protein
MPLKIAEYEIKIEKTTLHMNLSVMKTIYLPEFSGSHSSKYED